MDHRRERLERHHGDRLEQLLVAPARLARLLEQVARAGALLGERTQIPQQRGLAVVARVPLAGERELVEAEAGLAPGAAVEREPGLGAVLRRDGERDPLERLERQRAVVAQLGPEARVGAQRGGGTGQAWRGPVRALSPGLFGHGLHATIGYGAGHGVSNSYHAIADTAGHFGGYRRGFEV